MVLESPQNAATVEALVYEGKLVHADAPRSGPAEAHEIERTLPPFHMPKGPLNRWMVAALPDHGVKEVAMRHEIETEGRMIDDIRGEIAERLFG